MLNLLIVIKCYLCLLLVHPVGIYMFKVNNRNTKARCEICLKLTILLTIVNFEQINAGWVNHIITP